MAIKSVMIMKIIAVILIVVSLLACKDKASENENQSSEFTKHMPVTSNNSSSIYMELSKKEIRKEPEPMERLLKLK